MMTKNPNLDKFHCVYCESPLSDSFMVRDEIWAEAGFEKNEVACFNCFEIALGRRATLEDFTDKPINNMVWVGFNIGRKAVLKQVGLTDTKIVTKEDLVSSLNLLMRDMPLHGGSTGAMSPREQLLDALKDIGPIPEYFVSYTHKLGFGNARLSWGGPEDWSMIEEFKKRIEESPAPFKAEDVAVLFWRRW